MPVMATRPSAVKHERASYPQAEEKSTFEKFSSKLFENLELFLHSPRPESNGPQPIERSDTSSPLVQMFGDLLSTEISASQSQSSSDSRDGYTRLDNEIIDIIGKANVFDEAVGQPLNTSLTMSYQEENMMLKHFFKKLLPLLDAHPQSPWPDLALKYCDFDVARSCFISLACIHIYESKRGGSEYYKKGMAHIQSTMNHLIQFISSGLEDAEEEQKNHIRSFVILVLVNVHVLFAVLEKGKSSLARFFFKVFGSVCRDESFYHAIMENERKRSLVVVLSWYDTVSAIVSPDCRLPFCSPVWYGSYKDTFSTLDMMGCPGEIFCAMSRVCLLRHEAAQGFLSDDAAFQIKAEGIRQQLFSYREYVAVGDGSDYPSRLKAAQCWGLAVYVSLLRLFPTPERQLSIRGAVLEFIESYGSMPSQLPVVTQMVWPVYAIGCECKTAFEREKLHGYMTTLYETAQMGTLGSLRWVVEQVWERSVPQEEVLKSWLEDGVDYLPL